MKKKTMIVTSILILVISIIAPVSAKETPYYKASGTIDGYVDVWSSEIISGHWSVKVKGDVLEYKAMYRELNLDEIEDSPVGSVDIFTHSFTPEGFVITGDVLVFWGTLHVKKVWVKLDWTREIRRWDSYVTITVTPDSFYLDSWPPGSGPGTWDQDWDRIGMTTHFKREGESPEIIIELDCILPYRVYHMEDPSLIAYQIYNRVNVFSGDGSEDISTVELKTPDGDVYDMTLEETYEYYAIYTHRMDLPAPLLGTWSFLATDSTGNTAETSFDVPSWIDVVPESVTPAYGQSIPNGGPLVWDITWGPDAPDFEHYEVSLFGPSGDEWWGETPEMPFEYDGPPLTEPGDYEFYIYAVMSIPGVMGGEVQIVGKIYVEPPT